MVTVNPKLYCSLGFDTDAAILHQNARTFLRVCTLDTACNAILQSTAEKTVFAPVDWTSFNALSAANQVGSCTVPALE